MVDEEEERRVRPGKVRIVGGKSVVKSRVAFSKDSRSLFYAYGSEVRVHSVKTGDLVKVFCGHSGEVSDLCLSEHNLLQLLSCCSDGHIIFWDILDGSIVTKCRSKQPLHGVSVHKDHPNTLFLVQECDDREEKELFCFGSSSVTPKNKGLNEVSSCLKFTQLCKIGKTLDSYSFSSEGKQVATIANNYLQIWHFGKKRLKKYNCKSPLVSVAFHPVDFCVATGHKNGKITIWRNLHINVEPVCTQLHWHAHPVESLKFSNDGAYLYSGGEESVLVFWQFESGYKQFKPRLGNPIVHICNSKDDTVIATCHKDNVINLVSAVDLSVVNVVQGLTKANHLCTGLVADPSTKSLVLNSQDGILQFYQPDTDSLAFTLDIVRQNYISKPKDEPLQMTTVEQVSFSKDGAWLTTVERRDDEKTTPEIRLKFWKFNKETQKHVLNTCIDPPHEGKVIAVEFQRGSFEMLRAMSAALDGKFKIWILKEQREIKGVREAWQCQSVGYLREERVEDATFSSDGSLLAVGYGQVVTLWDPCSNELQTTLYSPFSQIIRKITFGRRSCANILMASTKCDYLVAWDLLSCTVLWSVKADAISLLPDPSSHLIAVFVLAPGKRIHLYVFDPSSPIPLAIYTNVLRNGYLPCAVFQPNIKGLKIHGKDCDVTMARLFYMNKNQVLYTLDGHEAEKSSSTKEVCTKPEESEFYRIFEITGQKAIPQELPEASMVYRDNSSKFIREMLSSPSHVLPPTPTLCSKFLRSLLIGKNSERRDTVTKENSDDEDIGASTSHDLLTSDEESDSVVKDIPVRYPTSDAEDSVHEKETMKELSEQMLNQLNNTNIEWMKDLFSDVP